MKEQHIEASRFLSYVLRHQPGAIGIALDREGWTDIAALIAAASKAGKHLDRDLIEIGLCCINRRGGTASGTHVA